LSRRRASCRKSNLVMYEPSTNPPHQDNINVWSALATTERWISNTLTRLNNGNAGATGGQNPYARKEVSYACEMTDEGAMVIAGIFRRLKDAREMGEIHGKTEEDCLIERGETYEPGTLRQTQVIVIPNCDVMTGNFNVFDKLVQIINQARRNARDYVTDVALEKLDEKVHGAEEAERDWVVSVSCAHLHPKFGKNTPEQVLKEMEEQEEEGEVDLHLQAYKEKREAARRSPYPSLILEVQATPPPNFGNRMAASEQKGRSPSNDKQASKELEVTSQDIQRLEALFGKPAAKKEETNEVNDEDDFYNAIGKAIGGIEEISSCAPMQLAQNWIANACIDDLVSMELCAFTETDAKYVDDGYEFVFTNLAMQASKFLKLEKAAKKAGMRQYMVMPHFLSSSATSFEHFASEVTHIIDALPGLAGNVHVITFHPEHNFPEKRSPTPIFALEWSKL